MAPSLNQRQVESGEEKKDGTSYIIPLDGKSKRRTLSPEGRPVGHFHQHHTHTVKDYIVEEMKLVELLLEQAESEHEKPKELIREAHTLLNEGREFLNFHDLMVDEEDMLEGRNLRKKLRKVHIRLQCQREDEDGTKCSSDAAVAAAMANNFVRNSSKQHQIKDEKVQNRVGRNFVGKLKHMYNSAMYHEKTTVGIQPSIPEQQPSSRSKTALPRAA
mmetsp:Transcript_20660/g.29814  ORF Transcript_20660/g.29814 Transcript_20660/m.29814 type:complete len:217 (+) Transcript_20660:119-769(+)|eukprot:CAMPEP_0202450654 /NCGR_PEP_ID=MMETSP1360-20130828/9237_1 /ASSEMBLY_ACC=CAM_ASM_000848 /TAXON_ID=515479 /ORGANISM="Licmophora paradoxa, Strain CCMP2313" /LENGTH=216 /DNA_ID=CAMNT_0049069005 /DNA_START=11 /DNA_END=661 /DNA_ORIENTATION=+